MSQMKKIFFHWPYSHKQKSFCKWHKHTEKIVWSAIRLKKARENTGLRQKELVYIHLRTYLLMDVSILIFFENGVIGWLHTTVSGKHWKIHRRHITHWQENMAFQMVPWQNWSTTKALLSAHWTSCAGYWTAESKIYVNTSLRSGK